MKQYGKETQTIYMVKKKVDCIICDNCKKTIYPRKNLIDDVAKYYTVTTGHRDWGYDSADSMEFHDICIDCLPDFVSDYIRHHKKSNTDYIGIEAAILEKDTFDEDTVIE